MTRNNVGTSWDDDGTRQPQVASQLGTSADDPGTTTGRRGTDDPPPNSSPFSPQRGDTGRVSATLSTTRLQHCDANVLLDVRHLASKQLEQRAAYVSELRRSLTETVEWRNRLRDEGHPFNRLDATIAALERDLRRAS